MLHQNEILFRIVKCIDSTCSVFFKSWHCISITELDCTNVLSPIWLNKCFIPSIHKNMGQSVLHINEIVFWSVTCIDGMNTVFCMSLHYMMHISVFQFYMVKELIVQSLNKWVISKCDRPNVLSPVNTIFFCQSVLHQNDILFWIVKCNVIMCTFFCMSWQYMVHKILIW